jgi:hypothetical protein
MALYKQLESRGDMNNQGASLSVRDTQQGAITTAFAALTGCGAKGGAASEKFFGIFKKRN